MAWVEDRTRKTMTWLDCYGLYREAGVNQFKTIDGLDSDSAFVLGAQQDMEAGADAARAERVATTQYVGDALMAIGAIVLAASSETIAGAVIGALLLAVGAILSFFADIWDVECDKYHCGGYERDSKTRRKIYRAHIRTLVGVYLPDASEYDGKGDCSCNHKSHHCRIVQYLHDGLVMRGQNWDVIEGAPSDSGEVRGVNASVTEGDTKYCTEHWRQHAAAKPLDESGNEIPVGGGVGYQQFQEQLEYVRRTGDWSGGPTASGDLVERTPENFRNPWSSPWTNPEESYYYRAWKVRAILYWMMGHDDLYENILCRTMECMEETLEETSSAGNDNEFNQKRRRGSRWYSSLVWMMRDIWTMGQYLVENGETPTKGWETFGQVLRVSGVSSETEATLTEMAHGKEYAEEEVPFPWTPLFKRISFWQMRTILQNMKPHFPWIPGISPTGGEPYGEAAREKSAVLAPMLMPIREPIIFSMGMKPIPAKLGSGGIRWGVVGLGVGATVIGSYAIYKLLAPKEE